MPSSRLADFIRDNIEPILQSWEDFARSIEPPALTMDDTALRDHAHQMLLVLAHDLESTQSNAERDAKSWGLGEKGKDETPAETHAQARLLSGYTVVQLVSEYRALRSSVLALWAASCDAATPAGMADITRFNEAVDQALAESIARYEQLVCQSRNMFLAILGHDLRNPLGTLVTGASFIMQAADVLPKYVLVAARMFSSAQRMSNLISDLIDFTRTHLGPGIPVRARHCDIVAICRQVVDELRTCHPERHILFEAPLQLDADADDGRVAQVVSNLVGNALQYGSVDAPVLVRLRDDHDWLTIAVNNRGPVIAADKVATIFDPFVRIAARSNSDSHERTSLGIGLFVTREIVAAHGGRIDVVSTHETGTTFTVTMPRYPASSHAGTPAPG